MASHEDPREAAQYAFDLIKRGGYDPHQVDGHVQALATQIADTERGLRDEQGRWQQERSRAERAESELADIRARMEALQAGEQRRDGDQEQSDGHQGFGYRVEKLLRVAEQEAAEVRSTASREATGLLERAREDAEAHRHEVEQSLIARTASLDGEATRRRIELDERERQITEHTAAARDEATRMLADVHRQAEQIKQAAQADAEQQHAAAEKAIRERRVEAEQELTRLSELRTDVRGNLGRLLESLSGEFRNAGTDQAPPPGVVPAVSPDDDATQSMPNSDGQHRNDQGHHEQRTNEQESDEQGQHAQGQHAQESNDQESNDQAG